MKWIYKKNFTNSARYVLGKIENRSAKTIICFGINPSTARPGNLDNTLKKVENISKFNNYDNWIMLNIYPQRATDINMVDSTPNPKLLKRNFKHIKKIFKKFQYSDVWLAYGNLIYKHTYFNESLKIIMDLIKKYNKKIKIIKKTNSGNPVHPLYQKNNSVLI